MSRLFERAKIYRDGKSLETYRIRCGKCSKTADWVRNSGRFKCGPEHPGIARHFETEGWAVGGGSAADRCPTCLIVKPGEKAVSSLRLVIQEEAALAAAKEKQNAPAEREMTREDRRLILAKLNEVYLDEARGYERGWTDHKLATDLGCPKAWIAELREVNFGPARDNEEIREFAEKVKELGVESRKLEKEAADIKQRSDRIGDEVRRLERIAAEVGKQTGIAA